MPDLPAAAGFPRLTYLRIKNYRALRDVELRDLTPLTVLIGPNGSGKSTVLDALAFLAEAVSGNLQQAWEKRNRFAGMRTRGQDGPIEFEVEIDAAPPLQSLRYNLAINEVDGEWIREEEWLSQRKLNGDNYPLFNIIKKAVGNFVSIVTYEKFTPDEVDRENQTRTVEAINEGFFQAHNNLALPVFASFQGVIQQQAVRVINLLTSYRYIHLTDDHLKGYSDAGPREKLSANGDNLPNVLYYLHTKHPEALAHISEKLRRWVPGLAEVVPEITSDERLLLRFRDAPFEKPLPAQYMSDGTMRLAALLTLLYEPNATGLLGIEEPENELHPRLLPRLAEELSKATETRQLLVATHSPFLLDALEPEQVWILHRGADGYTQATRTADIPQVKELVEDGSPLGYLWTSNFFRLGDPLAPRTSAAQ
ncbi:AAA family ATPase [Hymenobacter canadensis]|uniref:AAA family ATPase n=1 Tax=Hymenobacter canadensis TaxID=2999067 RepID=A0ABY7LMM2_9BACT|nr:AAA family ATPase [Hymenobacter canadensis]WBA40696.1 AAA family ATPase [Hymenobacter canadensis]